MENDIALYDAFFQKETAYYHAKLERFNNGDKYMFNLAAFVFGITWMLYRKMYIEAAVLFGIIFFEGLVEQLLFGSNSEYQFISLIINLVTAFAFGTLANFFYLQKAKRAVEHTKVQFSNQEERIGFLKKTGGTNTLAFVIVTFCVMVIITCIFVMNN